jgi:ABC-type transport system involved in multi-copper enzyme maturation permease subunit
MSTFLTALVLSSIITVLMLFLNYNKNSETSQSTYAIKAFLISFPVIFFGITYFLSSDSTPEIEIGEPDF